MIIVKTLSGSCYVLDKENMTWGRFREKPDDPTAPLPVRTKTGDLTEFPKITVGASMTLMCPPFVEGAVARALFTSPVTEVLEDQKKQ